MIVNSTIAAIATPEGDGGIGIVRISGPDAFGIAEAVFAGKKDFCRMESHTVNYGNIVDPVSGGIIDEALLIKMKAPRTYTREDVAELHCHGGMTILKKVLETVFLAGARAAEPGEFTLRAFLNGRIDLSQAEAVIDIINSKTEGAAKAAVDQLEGSLTRKLGECEAKLLQAVSCIEASIDYPEYEETNITVSRIIELTGEVKASLEVLIDSFSQGRLLREGISVVISGRPNSGKSSLMNELSGRERSIVTEIPGTTRDVVDDYVNIDGIPARIVDTAGLRESDDFIENIGIGRAKSEMDRSDVIIYMIDAANGINTEDAANIESFIGRNVIVALNKIDLVGESEKAALMKTLKNMSGNELILSVKTGEGTEKLREAIAGIFRAGHLTTGEAVMTNARHHALALKALESVEAAQTACESGMPPDIAVIDLRNALDAIGGITGKTVGEDVLHEIFSRFCLGK